MKGIMYAVAISFTLLLTTAPEAKADPILAVIKAGVKKAIKAIDLQIQRQQNKIIWLQNAQKTLENTMSKLRLDEIGGWVERQRDLYAKYFDELWRVKTMLTYYHRIKEITEMQVRMVEEYGRVYALFKKDKHFSPDEIIYMGQVYTGMLEKSVENMQQLMLVMESFTTQMNDADRLKIINKTADDVQEVLTDMNKFTNQNMLLSVQRAGTLEEAKVIRAFYQFKFNN
jgi:hypothetical protein